MDPVALILTALASGAAASLQTTTTQAIKDTYAGLKGLISKKFQGNSKAEVVLQAHEEDPNTWQKPMEQTIKDVGLDQNREVLKMAELLLKLVEEKSGAMGSRQSIGTVTATASTSGTAVGAIQVGGNAGSINIGRTTTNSRDEGDFKVSGGTVNKNGQVTGDDLVTNENGIL